MWIVKQNFPSLFNISRGCNDFPRARFHYDLLYREEISSAQTERGNIHNCKSQSRGKKTKEVYVSYEIETVPED